MSYVAAVGCDHVPDEYLTMLEPAAPQTAACLSPVLPTNPLPAADPVVPRTVKRSSPPPSSRGDAPVLRMEADAPNSSVSSAKHHQVPLSSRGEFGQKAPCGASCLKLKTNSLFQLFGTTVSPFPWWIVQSKRTFLPSTSR